MVERGFRDPERLAVGSERLSDAEREAIEESTRQFERQLRNGVRELLVQGLEACCTELSRIADETRLRPETRDELHTVITKFRDRIPGLVDEAMKPHD